METETRSKAPSNPFNDFVFLNATPSDRGSFSLATEKALAKLEKFQLPDPTFFILQWIQALVASGAKDIRLAYEESTLQNRFELAITFDGPGYTRTEVDALYDHVFRSGRDRSVDRLRELALGWLSACSLPISLMYLDSNGRRRIRKAKGEESTEASPPSLDSDQGSHRLVIQGKGTPQLDEIVKQKCKEVMCRLAINGDSVGGVQGGVPWPNRPFKNGHTTGVMGATYGGSATSHLSFLRYGVEYVNRPEESLQPPIIARVADDSLSKNVSQTDVVKDEAYEEFLARMRSEMKQMGLDLTRKRIPSYQREALNRFIQSYLVSYIDVRVFEDKERLKLMGEEFGNLITFPMFRVAGRNFVSLAELKEEYDKRGYLLYSLDQRGHLTRWEGVLLCLDVEEVPVLKKYFANLTALSFEEIRAISNGGLQQKLAGASRMVPVVSTDIKLSETSQNRITISLPDTYPTGQALIVDKGKRFGTSLPGVNTTAMIKTPTKLSTSETARLKLTIREPLAKLLKQLCIKLSDPEISRNQSRMRYAELACELIVFLGTEAPKQAQKAPIIGLEDGSLVSLLDIKTYLSLVNQVYLGGAFVEGLESGALDPMPCAEKLLRMVLVSNQITSTESVRDRIEHDPELKLDFRRQTLMRGLSNNPNPAQALKNFASEAAAQAELVAQMEKEYKEALKGPKLFIKPDDERLRQLAEETEEDDFVPFDMSQMGDASTHSQAPESNPVTPTRKRPALPTLEQDMEWMRAELGDFCAAPQAVHTERREEEFALHLSTIWGVPRPGSVHSLCDNQKTTMSHQLPLEGFLRVSPDFQGSPTEILKEGVEQLVLKVLHAYKSEPMISRQRKRLREWLLECCRMLKHWSVENRSITNDLLELPLIPCLGERVLSLTQLRNQASRLGRTLVHDPQAREAGPDPLHDVITWECDWRDELLQLLKFPPVRPWSPEERPARDFDTLLRGALKEMKTVVAGQQEDLIDPEVIGKLSGDSSFWTRWRAGFLSWDSDYDKALVNPNHKIGKKLTERYSMDPIWAALLASALFSTINRGLEEVEDHHEKAFLEGLLDTIA